MGANMHLQVDGIEGESKDNGFEKQIDVLSWAWGMSQPGSRHVGGGGGTEKVTIHDIVITKRVDKASPELHLKCANGKHIDKIVLTATKAGGNPLNYTKITMEDVVISGCSSGGMQGEVPLETITINPKKLTLEYFAQDDKGQSTPVQKIGWDVAENQKF